jgi:hypothetical protein
LKTSVPLCHFFVFLRGETATMPTTLFTLQPKKPSGLIAEC